MNKEQKISWLTLGVVLILYGKSGAE